MNTHLEPNPRKPEQPPASNMMMDLFALAIIFAIVCVTGIIFVNQKRQIALLDQQITSLEAELISTNSYIQNKRTEQAALQSSRVVQYAQYAKMTIPSSGQVCFIQAAPQSQARTISRHAHSVFHTASMASITQQYSAPYTVISIEQ